MVVSMLLALTTCPAMLGTQEAIRQGQAKERREEHRARRCNLIVSCVRSSPRGREINGKMIVLRDNKLYIDTDNTSETEQSSGHPFAGYYLPYPDSEYEGLVSTITHVAPILNWIYIDKDTYELKYGVRDLAQPHLTGPFDCTRQDRRLTFEDWEGFVAVEEKPTTWALYFDRDDTGLKGKLNPGTKVLEIVLTRQERKKAKDDASNVVTTDKEKAEQAGDHQASYVQGAASGETTAPETSKDHRLEEPLPPHVLSAADLVKARLGALATSSISSDHAEGTVGSSTEPWGTASMWSNQEQPVANPSTTYAAPLTPSSSIYGDDNVPVAASAESNAESISGRSGYRHPYVEDEALATMNLVWRDPETDTTLPTAGTPEHAHTSSDEPALDATAGAEQLSDPEEDQKLQTSEQSMERAADTEVASPDDYAVESMASIAPFNEDTSRDPSDGPDEHGNTIDTDHVDIESAVEEHPASVAPLTSRSAAGVDSFTIPRLDFQISHVDQNEFILTKERTSDPSPSGSISAENDRFTTTHKDDVDSDDVVAEDSTDAVPAHIDGPGAPPDDPPLVTINADLIPDFEGPSEPVSTPVNLSPSRLDIAGRQYATEEHPAWTASFPKPYWNASAEPSLRSYSPISQQSTPKPSGRRNFSRPQHGLVAPEVPSGSDADKSPPFADMMRMVEERLLREESAPPVTISREPYPVEDDPTSGDTSVVDASLTSESPPDDEEAADSAAETTTERASWGPSEGQQSNEPLAPMSTQSSATLGEPALQGNRQSTEQQNVKPADGTMQSTSPARPKISWRRSLATRLKASKENVLKRNRSTS